MLYVIQESNLENHAKKYPLYLEFFSSKLNPTQNSINIYFKWFVY